MSSISLESGVPLSGAFKKSVRDFVDTGRTKLLKVAKSIADVVMVALAETGGIGGGLQASAQLGSTLSISLGVWVIASIPLKISTTLEAIDGVIDAFKKKEDTADKVAAVAKLCFKEISGLAWMAFSGVIFISKHIATVGPVRVIHALGIVGAVFGLIHFLYEFVESGILAYELAIEQKECSGIAIAVLIFKIVSAVASLGFAVLFLTVLASGVVLNPWISLSVALFAVLVSIIAGILGKTYEEMEKSQKEAMLEQVEKLKKADVKNEELLTQIEEALKKGRLKRAGELLKQAQKQLSLTNEVDAIVT